MSRQRTCSHLCYHGVPAPRLNCSCWSEAGARSGMHLRSRWLDSIGSQLTSVSVYRERYLHTRWCSCTGRFVIDGTRNSHVETFVMSHHVTLRPYNLTQRPQATTTPFGCSSGNCCMVSNVSVWWEIFCCSRDLVPQGTWSTAKLSAKVDTVDAFSHMSDMTGSSQLRSQDVGYIFKFMTDLGCKMSDGVLQPLFNALWELQLSNYAGAGGKDSEDSVGRWLNLSRIVAAACVLPYDIF